MAGCSSGVQEARAVEVGWWVVDGEEDDGGEASADLRSCGGGSSSRNKSLAKEGTVLQNQIGPEVVGTTRPTVR